MAKRVGITCHSDFLKHEPPDYHPERPERVKRIMSHLREVDLLLKVREISFGPADEEWIAKVHSRTYIERVREMCQRGYPFLDFGDTYLTEHTFDVAKLAVGAGLGAADQIMAGEIDRCFCCVRPPGHHAEPERGMGFCIFNNVAVLARYLQKRHGIERVAIVDWDVHHGNGTQEAFYEDPTVFYFSIHQFPHYPGSGSESERGAGPGEGFTLNVPLAAGAGDREYLDAFKEKLVPALDEFRPQFVLISAGFDAHRDDPLSGMQVTEKGFRQMTELVAGIANRHASGRIISMLEGGYNLEALPRSVEAHIRALLKD